MPLAGRAVLARHSMSDALLQRRVGIYCSNSKVDLRRQRFSTAVPRRANRSSGGATSAFRVYRYVVDVHGQLFLHDTVPKNLTSCFKNIDFLDFFFKRIRPNPASRTSTPDFLLSGTILRHDILRPPPNSSLATDWSDVPPYNGNPDDAETRSKDDLFTTACQLGDGQGYEWISPCGPELNLVRCQDTPIVYRELGDDGMLKWAGSFAEPFRPDALVVDPSNGYVYHPSPQPSQRRSSQKKDGNSESRYGSLSLLGSNLVLSRLAEGLEIDPDGFEQGQGGSIEWQGKRYELGLLGHA